MDSEPVEYERKHNERKHSHEQLEDRQVKPTREDLFRCRNCSLLVTAEKELSGVNNRDHCPNCLCSKHVDLHKAGDRKARCHQARAPAWPDGETYRQEVRQRRTGRADDHSSVQRLRQDLDQPHRRRRFLGRVAGALQTQPGHGSGLLLRLQEMDIHPLQAADLTTVYSQLFGWQSIVGEFTPPAEEMLELEKTLSANDANVF